MGRMYAVAFQSTVASGASVNDLFQIEPAANKNIVVHDVTITQRSLEGDANASMMRVLLSRAGTPGTTGSSKTPETLSPTDAAASCTALEGPIVAPTGLDYIRREDFNAQAGFFYSPPPEQRLEVANGDSFNVQILQDSEESVEFQLTCIFEELG